MGGGGLAAISISTPHSGSRLLCVSKDFPGVFYFVCFFAVVVFGFQDFNTSPDLHYHVAHYVRLKGSIGQRLSTQLEPE